MVLARLRSVFLDAKDAKDAKEIKRETALGYPFAFFASFAYSNYRSLVLRRQ
jgi:hypothetical protein